MNKERERRCAVIDYSKKIEALILLKKREFDKSFQMYISAGVSNSEACSNVASFAEYNSAPKIAIKFYRRARDYNSLCRGAGIALNLREYQTALDMYKNALPKANGQSETIIQRISLIEKKILKLSN